MADVCIPSSAGTGNLNLLCSLDLAGKAAGTYTMAVPTDLSRLNTICIIVGNLVGGGGDNRVKLSIGGHEVIDMKSSTNWDKPAYYRLILTILPIRTAALGIRSYYYISGSALSQGADVTEESLPTVGAAWKIELLGAVKTGTIEIYGA